MEQCPMCNGPIVLWKDVYDRFEHFFECTKCKSRFWMGKVIGQVLELTPEANAFVDGYMKNWKESK